MIAIRRSGLSRKNREKSNVPRKNTIFIHGAITCLFCYHSQLYAHNWRLTPYLQLQEDYSDNINLKSAKEKKSAFVTSLSPGASIVWQAGKSSLNLRYNMQNLYNAHGDDNVTINHQLQLNAHNVLSQNRLFVDTRSSISQQNSNNNVLVSDNISGENTTTVSTAGISPTWMPRFGHYANGSVRINADAFTSNTRGNTQNNALSDSVSISENIQLNSGSKFKRISWSAGFNNFQTYRAGGNDINFQNASATLRTYIDKHFNVFATVGHSANSSDVQTIINKNQNGFFYTVGARWTPSQHYWLEAGGGNNSYATINISPMRRLSWLTTVRHNSIGLNSGTTWQTALNYQTRRSRWSLTHNNDTTTAQQNFSKQVLIDGNPEQLGLQPILIPVNNTSFTDSVIVSETWNLSASFFSGKSSISVNAFNQDRNYDTTYGSTLFGSTQTHQIEHIRGVSTLWNWQFARKTSAYLRPQWQQIDRNSTAVNQKSVSQDNRYDVAIGLNQAITNKINARLELRHIEQMSTLHQFEYQENRATANLFMRF
jgi:uncharacterized protein (PEP-CTERM system associated)